MRIPKGDGKQTRPIGIPTFEDKILQRAVTMVLEAIYEQDFLDCSYGFRPGRSAHMALEDGCVRHPDSGTPQGGVISPLLANIYLHEVVDTWFETQIKPRLAGRASLFRYADDFVIVFTSERDARRVLETLPKRVGRYGLSLHPDKTRLIDFRRPPFPKRGKHARKWPRPGTFDLLGFTHFWGLSRRGIWAVQRRTARDRLSLALKAINLWCRYHRHKPVAWQHVKLVRKLRGHCAYYGITGNGQRLWLFRNHLLRTWRSWLSRRSQRSRLTWDAFNQLLVRHPMPAAIVVKSVYRQAAKP